MHITLDPLAIFQPCRRCSWQDDHGCVRLSDDQQVSTILCRSCAWDLFKSLLAATLLPPVCGGGHALAEYDPLDRALIDQWEAEGNPPLPSEHEAAA